MTDVRVDKPRLLIDQDGIMSIVRMLKTQPDGRGGYEYGHIGPMEVEACIRSAVEVCSRKAALSSSTQPVLLDSVIREVAEGIIDGDDNPTAALFVAKALLAAAPLPESTHTMPPAPDHEGFYEKLWKDFVSLQRGDAQGICEKVERYYREQQSASAPVSARPHIGPMIAMPEWIPASDRLPEGDGEVLVTHKLAYEGRVRIRSKSTVRAFLSDRTDTSMADVLWMPLPEAPWSARTDIPKA